MVVGSWLERAAAAQPLRPAVNELTYGELYERASALATTLEPGSRIGLALPAGPSFAIALHAALLAGAVAVPIDPRQRPSEHPATDHLLAEQAGCDAMTSQTACSAGCGHELDAVAVIVRTSGTTASPREVALTYGNWLWSALGSAVALGLDPAERWLCAMPLTHVGGLSILIRSAIYGTSVVLHERFDTGRVLDALSAADGPTLVSLVPTTLARLLDAGLRRPPALRTVLLGGAPTPPGLLERASAAGVHVTPTYGMTEACSQVATHGRPLFCTRIEIAADGEILVGGPTVAPASAGPDGLLRTGDLGRFTDDGLLELTGRKADTIITGGENVSPAEVELAFERHPDVLEAAAVGVPDAEWGEALVVLLRLRPGAADTEQVVAAVTPRLAPHQRPKQIVQITAPLPRTASGKLLRRRIDRHELTGSG